MTDEWKAPAKASAESGDDKSWKLLEKTLLASVQEQRRSRRWGIFFKLLTFVYLFGAIALFSPLMDMEKAATLSANYTALIDVTGMIADKEPASADNIVGSLRAAFEDKKVKGVILRINSPGGSPVQSGYVYDEIRRLRGLHPDTKLYAVISDLGASGAYYIASAADQIYADKASLVGSIGVTAAGYGFVGTMEKLGVERRTYTSGEHKSFLDPLAAEAGRNRFLAGCARYDPQAVHQQRQARARRSPEGQGASGAVLRSGLVRRAGAAAGIDRWAGQCQFGCAGCDRRERVGGLYRSGVAIRSLLEEARCQRG